VAKLIAGVALTMFLLSGPSAASVAQPPGVRTAPPLIWHQYDDEGAWRMLGVTAPGDVTGTPVRTSKPSKRHRSIVVYGARVQPDLQSQVHGWVVGAERALTSGLGYAARRSPIRPTGALARTDRL
jgi:hypothetical protein